MAESKGSEAIGIPTIIQFFNSIDIVSDIIFAELSARYFSMVLKLLDTSKWNKNK